jgi:hypothetical protein
VEDVYRCCCQMIRGNELEKGASNQPRSEKKNLGIYSAKKVSRDASASSGRAVFLMQAL